MLSFQHVALFHVEFLCTFCGIFIVIIVHILYICILYNVYNALYRIIRLSINDR